jgi:hypothetical protein
VCIIALTEQFFDLVTWSNLPPRAVRSFGCLMAGFIAAQRLKQAVADVLQT